MKFYIILHNIRSLYNVGSLFRTAEGAGVKRIFLSGYTPSPFDRLGCLRKDFAKTALGAEKFIAFEKHKNVLKLIKRLKSEKIFITALEQHPKAIFYKKFKTLYRRQLKTKNGLVLILGNEIKGVSKNILQKSDAVIQIPMAGKKESLNVAVAGGIAMYELAL